MTAADRFNSTGFSLWINSHRGRVFRLVAGLAWLAFALAFRDHWWGVAAGVWSVLPLSAGVFDVCWVSAALGGPLAGRSIRAAQGRPTPADRIGLMT